MDARQYLSGIRVVLSRTSHPGNIGAAARAMKTMGFTDLVLVEPRHFPDPDATAMAAGAADILEGARVVATLPAALADRTLAVGFSARGRDLSHPPASLRSLVPSMLEEGGGVALVFGNETSGLSNEELALCQRFASIPANPEYSSLNVAAAVQVACYDLAMGADAHPLPTAGIRSAATGDDLRGLFEHLESSTLASGYWDPARPGRFMERMRRLFARTGLEREEVRLIRGMLSAFDSRMRSKGHE
ncbi:MAG: RNA methyltransferase [Usitatibacter sp.]